MACRAATCIGRRSSSLLSSLSRPPNTFSARSQPPLRISFSINQPGSKHQICCAHKEATLKQNVPSKEDDVLCKSWKIKMLYDGECPLCMREVSMLKERNKLYGTIKFVDISSNDYSAEENQDLDYETVMGRIHAILADGTVVRDVEAFRRLYEEVGLGWVYAITKYEPIATIASTVYGVWAKYRMQITGRPPLEEILEARRRNMGATCKGKYDSKT